VPTEGTAFVSVKERDKPLIVSAIRELVGLGFKILATGGTARYLQEQGIEVTAINKVLEGRPHIVDALKNGDVQLVLNTTEGAQALADSLSIRRTSMMQRVPYYTTVAGAYAAVTAIEAVQNATLEVAPLQSYN